MIIFEINYHITSFNVSLKMLVIYLLERRGERKRERERRALHCLGQTKAKGPGLSLHLPHGCQETKYLDHHQLPPGVCIRKQLDQKQG